MPKSRLAYILLAVFLGSLGIHNFYAGYTGKAIAQLLITLISFGFLSLLVWIWAIVEICTVTKDAQGVDFIN
ncbi:MAG: TM2 domain-containing protein [Akkermansia sp.]|nr:TM2 domain-containing protein [Akkermansia sp.]